uniref:Uncharacterized protein n=1 Tax=Pectinophora gossypiella TaxID=13191 RepID=A0A1E1WCN2_PECGO
MYFVVRLNKYVSSVIDSRTIFKITYFVSIVRLRVLYCERRRRPAAVWLDRIYPRANTGPRHAEPPQAGDTYQPSLASLLKSILHLRYIDGVCTLCVMLSNAGEAAPEERARACADSGGDAPARLPCSLTAFNCCCGLWIKTYKK